MNKLLYNTLIFCCLSATYSCSRETVGVDTIYRAEAAVNAGHNTMAQNSADSIMEYHSENLDVFTPSQLCRLAMVYKKLADNSFTGEETNLAIALKLYKKAFEISADSVILFRRSLTLDDAAAFEVLSSLHAMTDAPVDLAKEEPIDSIGLEGIPYSESAISH